MKLILIRHGETIENKKGILQGHLPGTLSKKGIEQAKKLALRLKNEQIDCIYSSDSARAVDTAKEIIRHHPNIPIYFVKELRETNLGDWTGKQIKEIEKDNLPKNIETKINLINRVKKLLNKVFNQYSNKTILFVSHNWTNKALITYILKKPTSYINQSENLTNASINIFEIFKNKEPVVYVLNCTKHL